ncbi:MAG: VCBS repeat-containing protein, partial [Planctomycetales bacterium]|nr:VCBS repeat-containing protein [Planctomycetales bacterium]
MSWFANSDGQGNFGPQQDVSTGADQVRSVALADIDGDDDLDILSGSYNYLDSSVVWHPNTDGQGTFGTGQIISRDAVGVNHVLPTDMNGDGHVDVITASMLSSRVSLFLNGGQAAFGTPVEILTDASGTASTSLADVDGDGDEDLVVASYWDNKISWYENLDGRGTFALPKLITNLANRAQSVRTADIDLDGDLDVVSASYGDGKIAWYENLDARGNFGPQQVITNRLNGPVYVHIADLDDDGDMDVLSASISDSIVAWYENTDGAGTFGAIQILTRRAIAVEWIATADLDDDGDIDIVSASYGDSSIKWFEH